MTSHVQLLERAIGYTLRALRAVEPGLLSRQTPCARWDLELLLWHTVDSLDALRDSIGGTQSADGARPTDPVRAVRDAACELLGATVTIAPGDRPVAIGDKVLMRSVLLWTGALEITAHGWDIGQTCGGRYPVPAGLADDLLHIAPALITDEERCAQFAAPVAVPSGVSASDRLVAFLGRNPAA